VTRTRPWAIALLLATAVALAACGDDDDDVATADTSAPADTSADTAADATADTGTGTDSSTDGGTDAAYPVTVTDDEGEVVIEAQPVRIVSLSPSLTEILFAIGAGDQVVAVDDFSNYPPEAPITDLSGYEPNIEAIAGYEPDLVVLGSPGDVPASLEALGITAVVLDTAVDLDDAYEDFTVLGQATGHADEADAVVEQMRADIDAILAEVPEREAPLRYYHELDGSFFSVTGDTFIGQLYSLAGLESIADQTGDSSGYPQLSEELIVDADPQVIFLACTIYCGETAESVAARPGWDAITAVSNGNIVELDDDVASRWGPRVVDLLQTMVDATAPVTVG
jgi:iron complex transport system substrate-binding protein